MVIFVPSQVSLLSIEKEKGNTSRSDTRCSRLEVLGSRNRKKRENEKDDVEQRDTLASLVRARNGVLPALLQRERVRSCPRQHG